MKSNYCSDGNHNACKLLRCDCSCHGSDRWYLSNKLIFLILFLFLPSLGWARPIGVTTPVWEEVTQNSTTPVCGSMETVIDNESEIWVNQFKRGEPKSEFIKYEETEDFISCLGSTTVRYIYIPSDRPQLWVKYLKVPRKIEWKTFGVYDKTFLGWRERDLELGFRDDGVVLWCEHKEIRNKVCVKCLKRME